MEEKEEQNSAIILDEIEGNEENFSGDELEELEEIEDQLASNDFNEAEKNDEAFSVNELDENDEEFSGNELDEPETGLDGQEDKKSKTIPDQEPIKKAAKRFKGKSRLSLFIAVGLVFLSWIAYLFIKGDVFPVTSSHREESKQVSKFAIPKDHVLVFDSFVIPFEQGTKFSYISLTVVFKSKNKELRAEMAQEKCRLRGIIYDMLSKEINGLNDVPSLERLKNCIIKSINGALSMGKINNAYITDLIAV